MGALRRRSTGIGGPRDVLALQRLIGNAAAARLACDEPAPTVQRKKSEQEKADKQRRVALATTAIASIDKKVTSKIKAHVFQGKPFDKEINKADPKGLHAYTDGALPPGMELRSVEGSAGRVHSITWRYTGNDVEKRSTMFPVWMPASHVNALLALDYPTEVTGADLTAAEKKAKSHVHTYASRGQTIKIGKSGETIYPE